MGGAPYTFMVGTLSNVSNAPELNKNNGNQVASFPGLPRFLFFSLRSV